MKNIYQEILKIKEGIMQRNLATLTIGLMSCHPFKKIYKKKIITKKNLSLMKLQTRKVNHLIMKKDFHPLQVMKELKVAKKMKSCHCKFKIKVIVPEFMGLQ